MDQNMESATETAGSLCYYCFVRLWQSCEGFKDPKPWTAIASCVPGMGWLGCGIELSH